MSQVEEKKRQDEAKFQAIAEKNKKEAQRIEQIKTKSYEINKEGVEEIYRQIDTYVTQARNQGFEISAMRSTLDDRILIIWKDKVGTHISLTPHNNGFKVFFRAVSIDEKWVSLNVVDRITIGKWCQWVAEDGKSANSTSNQGCLPPPALIAFIAFIVFIVITINYL